MPQPGQAEIEPTFAVKWLRRPTILPSALNATLKRWKCSRAPSSRASSRSSIHLTGLPRILLKTQVSPSSGWPGIFRPKPPPMVGAMMRICASLTRSAADNTQRSGCGFCVAKWHVYDSARGSHEAT